MSFPTLKVEISFTLTPSYPDNWQDVSAYVLEEGTDIRRGRSDELEAMRAGTATVTLLNNDRRFDPDYASSPYYPNVRPMQKVRISAVWDGDTYPLFVGYVQAWRAGRPAFGKATTVIQCVDGLGAAFAQTTIPEDVIVFQDAAYKSSQYDPLTGLFVADEAGAPMTSLYVSNDFGTPASGGTFRVGVFGEYTTPLPYTVTGNQYIAALEALSVIEEGSIYAQVYAPSGGDYFSQVRSGGFTVYFGGQYTGRNIVANITVDNTALLPSGAYFYSQIAAPATSSLPGVIQRAAGRDVEITLTTPVGVYGPLINVGIGGILKGTRDALYEEIGFTNVGPRVQIFPREWEQIFRITIGPWGDNRNGANTVAVRILNDVVPSELSGAMFRNAAQYGGWPLVNIDADNGVSVLLDVPTVGKTLSSVFQSIAVSEGGAIFIARDGYLTFKDRGSIHNTLSIATFGPPEDGYLPYEDATPVYDERYIRNSITITAEGGDPQNVQNNTSIERYYIRSYEENGSLVTTDAEALSRAQFLLFRYKEPQTRLDSIVLRGDLDPTNLWPIILGAELTNKYTVVYQPTATSDVSKKLALEGINFKITRSGWQATWNCSPTIGSIFILDQSLLDGPDILLY